MLCGSNVVPFTKYRLKKFKHLGKFKDTMVNYQIPVKMGRQANHHLTRLNRDRSVDPKWIC